MSDRLLTATLYGALLVAVSALVLSFLAQPAGAQSCVTVKDGLAAMGQIARSMQIDIAVAVVPEPDGDQTIVAISPQRPTSLHLRFHQGCFVRQWEEPLPGSNERPPVDGTPA